MNKITVLILSLMFSAAALASYQPCVKNADFCVKFVNKSFSSTTVKSLSSVGFKMPGLHGLVIPPRSTTGYIPVFGGPHAFMLGDSAPWMLIMRPNDPVDTDCAMTYNNPVAFQPMACGVALSQSNPYDLVVKFNFFNTP